MPIHIGYLRNFKICKKIGPKILANTMLKNKFYSERGPGSAAIDQETREPRGPEDKFVK